MAADCGKLLESFNKLKNEHAQDLPLTIGEVKKRMQNLKDVLSHPQK